MYITTIIIVHQVSQHDNQTLEFLRNVAYAALYRQNFIGIGDSFHCKSKRISTETFRIIDWRSLEIFHHTERSPLPVTYIHWERPTGCK
jgi:hypothetical protein